MEEIYFSSTLGWDASLTEMFQMVHTFGLTGIELWTQHFDTRKWTPEAYCTQAAKYPVKTMVHSTSWDLNFASLNEGIRKASLAEIKKSIDLAAELKAEEVTVHPPRETLSGERSRYVSLARQGMEALLCYSEEKGVRLSFEIMEKVSKELVTGIETLKEITGDLYDSFTYTLDLAHCNHLEEFQELLEQLDHLSKIHLSNKQGNQFHTKLSEGDFDFYEVFSILQNKNVPWVIEGFEKGNSFQILKENILLIQQVKERLK